MDSDPLVTEESSSKPPLRAPASLVAIGIAAAAIVAFAAGWQGSSRLGLFGEASSPAGPRPEPSPTAASAATLWVQATVRASCHSIGGCGQFVELHAADTWWKAEFRWLGGGVLVADKGLPASLPAGAYALVLSRWTFSDAITPGDYWSRFLTKQAHC